MSLEFNDLLAQPFHKNVKAELEKRRSLSQGYENSPTLRNPYFKIKRLEKLSNEETFDTEKKETNLKFWELNKYSKDGLSDMVEAMNNGGNLKAPVGITDVSIELKDYTFHEVTVEFVVPNVNDWKAFKDTWLIFGAPVEYEFGKESLVEIEDGEDIRPDREIREGIIANFSWQSGENTRTITGSLTIYSSTFIELSSKAHPDGKESDRIASFFEGRIEELYSEPNDISFEDIKSFYGDGAPNIGNNFDNIGSDGRIQQSFYERTKYFYSVMSKGDYEKRINHINNLLSEKSRNVKFSKTGQILSISTEETREVKIKNIFPFGVDIINKDGVEDNIIGLENKDPQKPQPQTGDGIPQFSQAQIEFFNDAENRKFITDDGEPISNFLEWKSWVTLNGEEVPDPIISETGTSNMNAFDNYGKNLVQWYRSNYKTKRVLNTKYNFLSSTSLQKYILSQLNLEKNDNNIFQNNTYFYVSMRFVQDTINEYLSAKYGASKKDLISKYILEDIRVRNLSFLGFGSSMPDRILVNPWNKSYSKTDYEVDVHTMPDDTIVNEQDNTPKNRYYKYDSSGQYKLLEDIFISAPLLIDIANNSNSIMGLMDAVVNEIESATEGLIQLQRIGDLKVSLDRYYSNNIRYYDVSTIGDLPESKDYYEFNLFDPKEKLRNIDINSSIDDSVGEYAYYQSLGRVVDDKNIFMYDNLYYNEDGTINHDYTPLNNYVEKQDDGGGQQGSQYPTIPQDPSQVNAGLAELIYDKHKQLREESKEFMESHESLFQTNTKRVKDRIEKYFKSSEIDTPDENISLALLGFIQTYFSTIVRLYHTIYNNPLKSENTTTIPLKVDISLDGIAGIVTGNAFQINLESFPMGYNNLNLSPLFVVSTLNHSFPSNNDWETTVGGFLFIPSAVRDDAIQNSNKLQELMDSNNLILTTIRNRLEEVINEILSDE